MDYAKEDTHDAGAEKLRIAAIADLHTHQTRDGDFRALFADISEQADVLVMCGDLTNLGLPEEAANLAHDLAALKIPSVAVLGNHDHQHGTPDQVKRILAHAGVHILEEETFVHSGVGFAGVKGFGGGFGDRMLSSFGEKATKRFVSEAVNESLALENALQTLEPGRIIVALHYAPILETVQGEPLEIQPFIGCSRLGETIDRYSVAAVFHGHAHHGTHRGTTPRGVPVYNCCVELLRRTSEKGYIVVEV